MPRPSVAAVATSPPISSPGPSPPESNIAKCRWRRSAPPPLPPGLKVGLRRSGVMNTGGLHSKPSMPRPSVAAGHPLSAAGAASCRRAVGRPRRRSAPPPHPPGVKMERLRPGPMGRVGLHCGLSMPRPSVAAVAISPPISSPGPSPPESKIAKCRWRRSAPPPLPPGLKVGFRRPGVINTGGLHSKLPPPRLSVSAGHPFSAAGAASCRRAVGRPRRRSAPPPHPPGVKMECGGAGSM